MTRWRSRRARARRARETRRRRWRARGRRGARATGWGARRRRRGRPERAARHRASRAGRSVATLVAAMARESIARPRASVWWGERSLSKPRTGVVETSADLKSRSSRFGWHLAHQVSPGYPPRLVHSSLRGAAARDPPRARVPLPSPPMPAASGPDASHLEIRPAFAFSTPDERAPTAKIPRDGRSCARSAPRSGAGARPRAPRGLCGREDGAIVPWKVRVVAGGEVASSREMVRLLGHRGRVTSLPRSAPPPPASSPAARSPGGADATVRVWDAQGPSGAMLQRPATRAASSPSRRRARTSSPDPQTPPARLATGRPRRRRRPRPQRHGVAPVRTPPPTGAHPGLGHLLSFGATEDVGDHGACSRGARTDPSSGPDPSRTPPAPEGSTGRRRPRLRRRRGSSSPSQCVFARPEDGRGVTGVLYVPEERCVRVLAYDAATTIRDAHGAASARLENPRRRLTAVAEMPPARAENADAPSETFPERDGTRLLLRRAAASSGSSESPFSSWRSRTRRGSGCTTPRAPRYRAHVTGSA